MNTKFWILQNDQISKVDSDQPWRPDLARKLLYGRRSKPSGATMICRHTSTTLILRQRFLLQDRDWMCGRRGGGCDKNPWI